jgi:hypothetical protein
MTNVSQPESEANQQRIEFLRIEISLAITFMDVVETSRVDANQRQGERDAQKAYLSARHLHKKLLLTSKESIEIGALMTAEGKTPSGWRGNLTRGSCLI